MRKHNKPGEKITAISSINSIVNWFCCQSFS